MQVVRLPPGNVMLDDTNHYRSLPRKAQVMKRDSRIAPAVCTPNSTQSRRGKKVLYPSHYQNEVEYGNGGGGDEEPP